MAVLVDGLVPCGRGYGVGGYPGMGVRAHGADTGGCPWYGSGPLISLVLRHFQSKWHFSVKSGGFLAKKWVSFRARLTVKQWEFGQKPVFSTEMSEMSEMSHFGTFPTCQKCHILALFLQFSFQNPSQSLWNVNFLPKPEKP